MKTFHRIVRIGDIPMNIHYMWIIAALIGAWVISARIIAEALPQVSGLEHMAFVLLILAISFAAVVHHEAAHYLVARMLGQQPHTITLYPFGGVPHQLDQRAGAIKAIWIALAGPIASLALWGLLSSLSAIEGLAPQLKVIFAVTAQVNLVLALINLLPGLPLDGGRVVRAIAWQWTLNYATATAIARKAGQAIAYMLVFSGAWLLITPGDHLFALLLVLMGWAMREAGSVNQQRTLVNQVLHKLTASDLAYAIETSVTPNATLRQVYTDTLQGRTTHAPMPVILDGRFLGILTMHQMLEVPQGMWDTRTVANVMEPIATLPRVAGDTPISIVVPHYAHLQELGAPILPVVRDEHLIGLIDPVRMEAILELEGALALYGRQRHSDKQTSGLTPIS